MPFCVHNDDRPKNSRLCKNCRAAYMRKWRRSHPLSDEQRIKANARSYANVYQARGLIKKEPCLHCGADNAEKHHPDYSKPLLVVWLCRECRKKIASSCSKT